MPPLQAGSSEPPVPQEEEYEDCEGCARTFRRNELTELEGNLLCEDCFHDSTFECPVCNEVRHIVTTRYYGEDDDMIACVDCHTSMRNDGRIVTCPFCDSYYPPSQMLTTEEVESICRECAEERGIDDEQEEITELQDNNMGKIITSPRRFGIELETVYREYDSVQKLRANVSTAWELTGDGSIRTGKASVGGTEIVSPVMKGKKGEDAILLIEKEARKARFLVNASCGYHLHLEATDYKRLAKDDKKEPHATIHKHEPIYVVQEGDGEWKTDNFDQIPVFKTPSGKIEKVKYRVEIQERNNLITRNRGLSFYLLRDLMYVYLAFDDVFRGMQPPSRRNNRFCKATSSLYSISEVRELEDYSDLERMWYKVDKRLRIDNALSQAERRKNSYKDSSRYVGFNLEPLLRKGGKTIELRYHSPTLNSEKILRWIDIHQTIFDKVATGQWDEEAIEYLLSNETHLVRKAKEMARIFGLKKETTEYMLERLNKFNKINAKEEELQDEEVEESDVGRPSHNGPTVPRLTRFHALTVPQARADGGIRLGYQATPRNPASNLSTFEYAIDRPTAGPRSMLDEITNLDLGDNNNI